MLLWTLVHPWGVCVFVAILYTCLYVCQLVLNYVLNCLALPWGTHVPYIVWEVKIINFRWLKARWFVGPEELNKQEHKNQMVLHSMQFRHLLLLLPSLYTPLAAGDFWTGLVWSLGIRPSFSLITAWLEKQLLRALCLGLRDIDGSCRCREGGVARVWHF